MNKLSLRSMIVAPRDHLILSCDLSQAESWIVAYLSDDSNMKTALNENRFHETTTAAIFDIQYNSIDDLKDPKIITKQMRYVGKRTNHASAYRMTPERFAEEYNLESPDGTTLSVRQARKYQDAWHNLYPNVRSSWWPDIDFELISKHQTLTTPYGFRCTFYGPLSNEIKKQATAFVPQSTVADHFNGEIQEFNPCPGGLVTFMNRVPKEVSVVNQSHDSFMAYVPKQIIEDIYFLAMTLFFRPIIIKGESCCIPVDGEVGERWGELEKIK